MCNAGRHLADRDKAAVCDHSVLAVGPFRDVVDKQQEPGLQFDIQMGCHGNVVVGLGVVRIFSRDHKFACFDWLPGNRRLLEEVPEARRVEMVG